MKLLISLLMIGFPFFASAWGGRGHHVICEAAVSLVKEKNLREFLQFRPQVMGHLCNIPDTHWRNLGSEASHLGNSTHFVDADALDLPLKDIPLDFQVIVSKYTGKKNAFSGQNIRSIPVEFGSNWWRADQFFRRAVDFGKVAKSSPAPANAKEEQDNTLPYNHNVYEFMVNLGLMGHFVGDNSQPFHLTSDYDGYKAGRGGIHGYYEDVVVSALPYDLSVKVVEAGQKLQKNALTKAKPTDRETAFLGTKTVVEKMRALGDLSFGEIKPVLALDKVVKPSKEKSEKGMSIRERAEREPAEKTAPQFEKIIVQQMARAAALLAESWDEAYVQAGRPELQKYKSYLYPFTPDFVRPDYFDIKK